MQTTLNRIKLHSPCEDGWEKLLNHLYKTQSDDEPLELRIILESNGLDDTIWALRAVEGKDNEIRLFAADCAELVLPIYEKRYPDDSRPRMAIQAARDYANGLITLEEVAAAGAAAWAAVGDAAWDAARDAAWAAWSSVGSAARDAAWAAVGSARDAAWAAWAAVGSAARDAARAAARDEIKQLLHKYI
jgi:hypothetical protein